MAQNTLLEGLRSQLLTSIFGRRLGLDSGDFLVGPKDLRTQVDGVTSGSTLTSTSAGVSTAVGSMIPPYGLTLIGASAASATTGYNLEAPVPGVRKTLFVATTGYAVVGTTVAGAKICSSASVTSTYGIITFTGKGNICELMGLTTALWGVLTNYAITTVTTGNTVSFV